LQPTPFLGREREVQQIVERLRRPEVRFLTLTGPGGTGKTRLALQAAAELLDDFADGVFFIQLAPLTDPELVLPTTATTLGLREEGGQPLGERLRDFLATKQLLLVLDNFEHLAAAAPGIGGLLAASPGLKVLATSRMPLRIRAEQEYAVTPLGLPRRKPPPPPEQLSQYEAVRLFIERAQAVKADFTIDNATAPAVAEICWRLDGLPLAIELAAARIRMLPPQAMLARLEQRLPMLTGGARDAPERQRTLRNTIAWSYDLLSPEEQALFRRLAVFVGGCTFEAVEAVTNPDGELDVFGGLERLVEHSLVRQEEGLKGEPRFSMLETIREFGLEKLEASGGTEEARQAHARWCLNFLKQDHFNASDEREWYDRIETEHDNIRAALGWVIQRGEAETALHLVSRLVRFWETRGYYGEGLAWAERARALQGEIPLLLRASGCNAVGELAMWTGNPTRAGMMFTEGLALAREAGDQGWVWMFLRNLGQAALNSRAYPTAMARYEEAYAVAQVVAQEEGDQSLLIDTRGLMGELALQMGDHAQATELLTEALVLSQAEVDGDYQNRANPLAGLAWIALHQGDLRGAAAHYGESLRLFWDQRDAGGVAEILCGVAATAVERHPEPATRVLAAGMGLLKTIGLAMIKTPGVEHELSDQVSAVARQALGEEQFTTAWATGQAMSLEDAVREALELITSLTGCEVDDPGG
jgi:predicted ATPase